MTLTDLSVRDIRFPTSRALDGSDAMNVDPDYSATYVVLRTDAGLEGHGLTFTTGRGNEVVCAAVRALAHHVKGKTLEALTKNMAGLWRRLTRDSQLRWLGPEKGVIHLATSAILNALWDLWAKSAGKPVWKLVCDMSPEEIVSLIDFHYITDALTPDEALAVMLMAAKHGVAVCPHGGGVGLCEMVQHFSLIDAIAVSGSHEGRILEYVDHLHEHFVDPVVVRKGRYLPPARPGYSTEMKPASLDAHEFPHGSVWSGR